MLGNNLTWVRHGEIYMRGRQGEDHFTRVLEIQQTNINLNLQFTNLPIYKETIHFRPINWGSGFLTQVRFSGKGVYAKGCLSYKTGIF